MDAVAISPEALMAMLQGESKYSRGRNPGLDWGTLHTLISLKNRIPLLAELIRSDEVIGACIVPTGAIGVLSMRKIKDEKYYRFHIVKTNSMYTAIENIYSLGPLYEGVASPLELLGKVFRQDFAETYYSFAE